MRLNEKNVASFAVCSSPVDKEGYLQKKGDLNRDFQRRWFVLKGNLLFYFQKKQDREPQGVIVLEACSVQVSTHGRYCFEISFDGVGTRVYVLGADNDADMQQWMKAISHASYEYLKSIVDELQRRVNVLSSSSTPQKEAERMEVMNVGPVASSTSASRPKPSKETTVTLEELCNPVAPRGRTSQSTKIRKGVLVDVSDDEAPPIPAKTKKVKSMTMQPSNRGQGGVSLYTERLLAGSESTDGGLSPPQQQQQRHHSPLASAHSFPSPTHHRHVVPHSSPLVPATPLVNTSNPHSPPATLDRTPVLQPSPASPPSGSSGSGDGVMDQLEAALIDLSTRDTSQPSLPPSQHNGGVVVERTSGGDGPSSLTSSQPSSHPPQVPCRKLAAPLDPSKTFIEMHEDFTQAMKALTAQRTGGENHSPS